MKAVHRSGIVGGVLGVAVVSASAAQAQNPVGGASAAIGLGVKKPLHIDVGGYFPTDSDLKNGVSKNFVRIGASYDVWKSPVLVPVVVGGYVDAVLSKEKDTGAGKNGFSMVGVGVQAKQYFPLPIIPVRFYGGLGVGPYFVRVKSQDESKNKSAFGGKLFLGAEFANMIYGNLDYTYVSKVSVDGGDFKPSGFGASIGVRF